MTAALPGLSLTAAPRRTEPEPLRTDVAALLGRTRRGPVGVPVRVESWPDAQRVLGPLDGGAATPYALHGFFENGGRTAWVVRVAGPGGTAGAMWTVGEPGGVDWPARAGFRYARYRVAAASPGAWANNTRVSIRFRASSIAGPPALTVRVAPPGEPAETFTGVRPADLVEALAASRLVRLEPDGPPLPPGATSPTGPLSASWEVVLGAGAEQGSDAPPGPDDYRRAVEAMADLPEPALVALPDLAGDLGEPVRTAVVLECLATVAALADRLVVLDVPEDDADAALSWVDDLAAAGDPALLGAAAVYHPRLVVPDPAGGPGAPTRAVPASGHVLGLVARLDAERGAHHTPANAVLLDAVDLAVALPEPRQARLFDAGVNLLRCAPGRGLRVWGGRTLATAPGRRYVAHRRLVHLLVRALRRVADPLVFDVNGPELRLALVRGVTSVLLEAFRSGALAGARAAEAFRVTCDDTTNPPGQDVALVVCDVEVAPATPMEFIRLRLVLGQDRGLEVIEA
ncbi:phage tail sheath subtilisin-like domain-containing protein [Phytohabitans houttuyneae]|uniref:Tail protein n=1 Tax=Phytohabitans houttuyneae TaxID=1076126 RepID=A0A6V8KPB8_9ACTN|nr:phage tail sheath subtilisin-like domain-containing protein [Phytohabitans houttuyneae]GFJ84458.1 tail protein [Phytohabitans houttuyneae]